MSTTTARWLPVVTLALATGCGGGDHHDNATTTTTNTTAGSEQTHATPLESSNMAPDSGAVAAAPDASAPSEPVTVTAGTPTPLPANLHPHVAISAPRNNSTVRTNRVEVRLSVHDWPAPQDARHIHLILDNEPYRRIDDPALPVVLENLAEGTHVLRAFPGWATHESVKSEGAFALVVFNVAHATADMHFDPHAPLLTYSRPKADYLGHDADRILLDFYIHNVPHDTLSATGFRVRYAIDGSTTGEATSWVPYYIEHLADGPHTVTLDLLGADGQPVAGPFNHTERQITVNRSAPTPPPHQHAAAAAPAAGDAGAH